MDASSVEKKLVNMGQRCSDTRIINFGAPRFALNPGVFLVGCPD